MNATKCQCLHFLVSLYSLTPCNAGVCPALRFSRKWTVSAGSVRGLWFLPRGKKVKMLGRGLIDILVWHSSMLNLTAEVFHDWNEIAVVELIPVNVFAVHFTVSPIMYIPLCVLSCEQRMGQLQWQSWRRGTPCQWQPVLISSCKVLSDVEAP